METNETAADQLQQLKQRIADHPWCELNMQQFHHTDLLAARDLLERARAWLNKPGQKDKLYFICFALGNARSEGQLTYYGEMTAKNLVYQAINNEATASDWLLGPLSNINTLPTESMCSLQDDLQARRHDLIDYLVKSITEELTRIAHEENQSN